MNLSLLPLSKVRRGDRRERSTSARKWRKLVWPLVLAGLCKPGFPTAKINEVYLLRVTALNDKNLEMADGILCAGDVPGLRNAVFGESWGKGGLCENMLLVVGVKTAVGCFLASFACRDYVDYELLHVVPVPAFDVELFAGRQLIFPV